MCVCVARVPQKSFSFVPKLATMSMTCLLVNHQRKVEQSIEIGVVKRVFRSCAPNPTKIRLKTSINPSRVRNSLLLPPYAAFLRCVNSLFRIFIITSTKDEEEESLPTPPLKENGKNPFPKLMLRKFSEKERKLLRARQDLWRLISSQTSLHFIHPPKSNLKVIIEL